MKNDLLSIHHDFDAAWNRHDLTSIMNHFSDDAVVTTIPPPAGMPDRFSGKSEIQTFVQGLLPGFSVQTRHVHADGDRVTWFATIASDGFRQIGVPALDSECEAVFSQGKIRSFTPSFTPATIAVLQAATAQHEGAALAREIYTLFNAGKMTQALPFAAEDVALTLVPFGQQFQGHEGFLAFMEGFKTAFPDCTVNLTRQISAPGRVVNEFVARGTHLGPMMTPSGTIPPTGRSIDYAACEVWTLEDGKLATLHNYFDAATVMNQLGLTPAHETAAF